MAALAVLCALATATCLGYYLGRRAGSTPSSRRRRTSRITIGARALTLLALMAERRVRRRIRIERWAPGVSCWRLPAALELLRGGLARTRSS